MNVVKSLSKLNLHESNYCQYVSLSLTNGKNSHAINNIYTLWNTNLFGLLQPSSYYFIKNTWPYL